MSERERTWLGRLALLLTLVLSAAMLVHSLQAGQGTGSILGRYSKPWAAALLAQALLAGGALSLLELSFTPFGGPGRAFAEGIHLRLVKLGWLNLVLVEVIPLAILWLVFRSQPDRLADALPRWRLLWLGTLLAAVFVHALLAAGDEYGILRGAGHYYVALLGAAALLGFLFAAAGYLLPVNDYPFSLGWSEGSRYYNASLFLAPGLYGRSLPLPVLHPTRYLLQAVPFLIPGASIRLLRLWQALLWIALPMAAAGLLVKRLNLYPAIVGVLTAAFAYVFFNQAPVYYHLIACTIPVLAAFDAHRPKRTLLWVLLASAWAGISRVNWWPVPGTLAALLFLLEVPFFKPAKTGGKLPAWPGQWWNYLRWPLTWGAAGCAVAYFTNRAYEGLSGNPPEVFGSAMSSPLLWERLWPNSTYGPGILLMTLLVLAPPIAVIALRLLGGDRWHGLRVAGVLGILLVFLAGGLVVSVKIGGGSNLHNLDALVFFLGVVLLYAFFGRFKPDAPAEHPRRVNLGMALLTALVVLVPVAQTVISAKLPDQHDAAKTADNLASLRVQVEAAAQQGEVLFLTERQLVTFKDVNVSNFDPDHEKVFLMEMAMANNQAYLQKFYADLASHHYSMIVAEPLNANLQDERSAFAEENNAWVERVELPILQYYELADKMPENNVYLYTPKP